MKVAVITRHAITNYGSLLQAMATQHVIETMGHECEIIDYIRGDESYFQHEKTLLKSKPKWNKSLVRRFVYLGFRQPESVITGIKFERERSKFLKLSKRYTDAKQLLDDKPIADVYLTGSDQVWGPVGSGTYDSSYCLSFTDELDKRVSYAASFGHVRNKEGLREYYKKWLSRYDCVTVREDSAVAMLREMELDAKQVLDPTLLLDESYWGQYLKPVPYKKFVLVYQLHNDKRVGQYAQKVAKAKGIPLVRISASFHQIVREGKFKWEPEIAEFLSYIKYAECIITDSFHGTAFAINFNRPFVEILPNNDTETRNISILKMTGLLDRILYDIDDIELAERQIDFSYANQILALRRIESLNLLRKMIEH